MSSLLKKARAHKLSFAPDPPTSSLTPPQTSPVVPPSPASLYEPSLHIDDFGRPISQPAFASPATGASLRFGEGYGVGDDVEPAPPHEMQLLYGYAPLSTTVELSIVKVDKVVAACADEIRRRESAMWGTNDLRVGSADMQSNAHRGTRHASHHVEHGTRHLARRRLLPHPLLPRRPRRMGSRYVLPSLGAE